jgi:hypothetical protein
MIKKERTPHMNINELLTINAAYVTGAVTVVVGLAIGAIGTAMLYSGQLPTGIEALARRQRVRDKAAGIGELNRPPVTGVQR